MASYGFFTEILLMWNKFQTNQSCVDEVPLSSTFKQKIFIINSPLG